MTKRKRVYPLDIAGKLIMRRCHVTGTDHVMRRPASVKRAPGQNVLPAHEGSQEAFEAIGRQTGIAPGTEEMEAQARRLARRIQELRALVAELDGRIEELSALVPEVAVLTSVPGIGRACATAIACEIGDVSRFPDANHLASYAGVAPVRHESGTSVRRKRREGGNRRPENALVRSAKIASKVDPRAKAYHGRKLAHPTAGVLGSPCVRERIPFSCASHQRDQGSPWSTVSSPGASRRVSADQPHDARLKPPLLGLRLILDCLAGHILSACVPPSSF